MAKKHLISISINHFYKLNNKVLLKEIRVHSTTFEQLIIFSYLTDLTNSITFFILTVIGPFCSYHLFVLTLASDMAVLYGNDALLVLVRSTKKRYPSFLKQSFRFLENLFQS